MFQHYVAVINLLLARETIQLVPPEDRPAPQGMSKTQHPLVLLDQQLKSLVREEERCHPYASILLSEGISPVYVQEQLGHATIELTVSTYGRWLKK